MMNAATVAKPLNQKAYGSIPHLPGSRLGPGDHTIEAGQAEILTRRGRPGDFVVVQAKLDGSCVAIAKVGGEIVPLGRAGYPAATSPWRQHRLFHEWVMASCHKWDGLLDEGERLVGEWLAQAHGIRYMLRRGQDPFFAFDLMRGSERATWAEVNIRFRRASSSAVSAWDLPVQWAPVLWAAELPCSIKTAQHGLAACRRPLPMNDEHEGIVWRVERKGRVDFLAKWVRHDHEPGRFLSGLGRGENEPEVWNHCDVTGGLA